MKTLDQLKSYENFNGDLAVKKRECRSLSANLVELVSNPVSHTNKDFVNYIGPSIASLITLCDSSDSDIRLSGDEGLHRIIKVIYFHNL